MTSKKTGGVGSSSKVSRPGIHSKNGSSKLKKSKLYKKGYRGQGK